MGKPLTWQCALTWHAPFPPLPPLAAAKCKSGRIGHPRGGFGLERQAHVRLCVPSPVLVLLFCSFLNPHCPRPHKGGGSVACQLPVGPTAIDGIHVATK